MRTETVDRIIGCVLLIVGVAILVFVLISALGLATAPGDFYRQQIPEEEKVEGPTAEFSWASDSLIVYFTDESQAGSADLSVRSWNFGDGNTSNVGSPINLYGMEGQYEVTLRVSDQNGKRSTARASVNVEFLRTYGGTSQIDESSDAGDVDMGTFGYSMGVGILMTGLYMVMFLVGAAILKAGWSMMKPKPERLKVKLKPKEVTIKEVGGRAAIPRETLQPPEEVAPPPPPEDLEQQT